MGILVTHVYYFLCCGTQKVLGSVIAPIKRMLRISSQASYPFRFTALNARQGVDEIEVDEAPYIDHLEPLCIDETSPNDRLLTEEERRQLKSAGGQLAWETEPTRTDMAFDGCQISNLVKKLAVKCLKEVNKAFRKIKSRKVRFPNLEDIGKTEIVCYFDATHASSEYERK